MRQLKITKQITVRETKAFSSYLTDVSSKSKLLTPEEEVALAQRIKTGDERALQELVTANLRFVISVAKQYQGSGLSLEDIIQFGNIGLITAAQRFDETKGFKFISYAVWWIRQSIMAGIADSSKIIRLPLNKVGVLNKTKRITAELEQRLERPPTNDEIYDAMNDIEIGNAVGKASEIGEDFSDESKAKITKRIEKNRDGKMLEDLLKISQRPGSIDAPVTDDSNEKFSDMMASNIGNFATDTLDKEDFELKLKMLFKTLKARESFVLTHFYGLFGNEAITLGEIGERLELTRERIRQIHEKAIRKMRAPSKSQYIKEFV